MTADAETMLHKQKFLLTETQSGPFALSNRNPPPLVSSAHSSQGHTLVEMLIVLVMIGVLTAFALPQLIESRRLSRSVGLTREVLTQLRYTRQLAMSTRQSVTFEYDDSTKQIAIVNHNNNQLPSPRFPASCILSPTAILIAPGYPRTACSIVVTTVPFIQGGLPASEITYGIPSGLPSGPLGDGISLTPLFNSKLNITFQADGSVINGDGDPVGNAMFIYNNAAARATASAISVMGASGRVKIWRYNAGANLYVE